MPAAEPEDQAAPGLATLLAERIAHRHDPVLPDQSAAAVAARLDQWLLTDRRVRNSLRRRSLAQLLLLLLAQPEASTETLRQMSGKATRSGARAVAQLAGWGFLAYATRQRVRYYRLTHAAEDALLPVVQGVAAG